MNAKAKAFELYLSAHNTSTAYRHFVETHRDSSLPLPTIDSFSAIPSMDKHNYITKYPVTERLYNGKTLSDFYMICSSSGSTGEPTFWPRDITIDTTIEKLQEALYEEHFQISTKKTLCVITFGLGVWTAGMLTSKLSWASAKQNKFTVVTPGIQKETTLGLIQNLSPHYDQVIIVGYPPFLSDLVEHAIATKFDLKHTHCKLLYTSEHVSEEWRIAMTKAISFTNDRHDVVSFYACSDTGIIGAETRLTIDLLHAAHSNKAFCKALFHSETTPSFIRYEPMAKYLEAVDGEILITATQPMPLIRYNIHDRGGLLTGIQIESVCNKFHIPFDPKEIDHHFAYIFGRSDSVKLTANIYIEDIRYCLEHSHFSSKCSGNFKYGTVPITASRYQLKIIIYLKPGESITQREKKKFEKEFYRNLLLANNDFNMIQSGTKIEPFLYEYASDEPDKYKSSKLKYFL